MTEEIAEEEADLNEAAVNDFVIKDQVIIQYNGTATAITLPLTDADGNPVVRLSEAVFAKNTAILSVTMPNAIQVDAGAFRGCTSLLAVSMHNSITTISAECFEGCTSLQSVSWPENLTTIDHDAFNGCTALTGVPTGTNLVTIGDNAFRGCTSLTYADLPGTVTTIGQGAFANCTNLREIVLPNSVTTLGNHAFENCSAATTLTLSNGLTVINNYTFSGCSGLGLIAIPTGVVEIGREAFYNCSGATLIRIPATVTLIGNNAFYGTPASGWIRWDICPGNAYIGTDGLGVSGYVLAPINSPAHTYCKSHSGVKFCSTLVRDFVERCYVEMLGRASDEPGLLDWCKQVVSGTTAAALIKHFTDSTEFKGMGLSNGGVIEKLYRVMLNRDSDPAGKANWQAMMDNLGVTKDVIINGFSGSQEFINLCATYLMTPGTIALTAYRDRNLGVTAFVARCYTEALERTFDLDGLENWCKAIITKKSTPAQVAYGFIFSKEVTDKKLTNPQFVHILYRTYFGRDEDAAGMTAWLNALAAGASRHFVNNGFASSQEFKDLLKTFGLK